MLRPPPLTRTLPPVYTSLYRLVLRTSSAAVLHHHAATGLLRSLFRPTFRDAALVIRRSRRNKASSTEGAKCAEWLATWNRGLDRTLDFLYTSANSRGLPHKVTRNLALLHSDFLHFEGNRLHEEHPTRHWDPNPAKYKDLARAKTRPKRTNEVMAELRAHSSGALEEVVRMAEGTSGMSLGRAEFVKRR